jgi:rfaE bifunctional protein nucleotidyltransferase chain/domain
MKSIDHIRSKITDHEKLAIDIKKEKKAGRKIIFTNGCFDILHRGHIEYLANASDLGDTFIIGLNSDESIRRIKGMNRPAVDEESRAFTLAALEFVDYVVLFSEENPSRLMQSLIPDVWVKGGDYTNIEELPEYKVAVQNGVEVRVLPFLEGFSTTDIFKRILGQDRS